MIDSVDKLNEFAANAKAANNAGANTKIVVSLGTCGIAAGGKPIFEALKAEVEKQGKSGSVEIADTGCMGLCHSEPTIEIIDKTTGESKIYGNVKAKHAVAIIEAGVGTIAGLETIERSWYYPEEEENKNNALQAKIVLKNSGRIDPEKIEDFLQNSNKGDTTSEKAKRSNSKRRRPPNTGL